MRTSNGRRVPSTDATEATYLRNMYHPEKVMVRKDTCTPMLTAGLFTIAKTWKPPRCPSTEEWIKKMWYIYICNGILLSHKK